MDKLQIIKLDKHLATDEGRRLYDWMVSGGIRQMSTIVAGVFEQLFKKIDELESELKKLKKK